MRTELVRLPAKLRCECVCVLVLMFVAHCSPASAHCQQEPHYRNGTPFVTRGVVVQLGGILREHRDRIV
jgi:hypothetical protein